MGLISGLLRLLFGDERNLVRETAEVFRENAEAGAERSVTVQGAGHGAVRRRVPDATQRAL